MNINNKYTIYCKVRNRIQYVLDSSLGIIDPHYRGMLLDGIMTILRDCIFTESEKGEENELYREETCDRKAHCNDYKYWHCIGCKNCKDYKEVKKNE